MRRRERCLTAGVADRMRFAEVPTFRVTGNVFNVCALGAPAAGRARPSSGYTGLNFHACAGWCPESVAAQQDFKHQATFNRNFRCCTVCGGRSSFCPTFGACWTVCQDAEGRGRPLLRFFGKHIADRHLAVSSITQRLLLGQRGTIALSAAEGEAVSV